METKSEFDQGVGNMKANVMEDFYVKCEVNKETVQVFCRGNHGRIGRQQPMTRLFQSSPCSRMKTVGSGACVGPTNRIAYVHLRDEFLHIVRDLEHL